MVRRPVQAVAARRRDGWQSPCDVGANRVLKFGRQFRWPSQTGVTFPRERADATNMVADIADGADRHRARHHTVVDGVVEINGGRRGKRHMAMMRHVTPTMAELWSRRRALPAER